MSNIIIFQKDDVIFREGMYEQCMYAINKGRVNISVLDNEGNSKHLVTLEDGQFFGEIGLSEALPRTATATAAQNDTELIRITSENFSDYFSNQPESLLAIMRHMNSRLRALTQEYLSAQSTLAQTTDSSNPASKKGGRMKSVLSSILSVKPSFLPTGKQFDEAAFLSENKHQTRITKTFKHKEVIFREGDASGCMYEITWGSVGIYANYGKEDQKLLTELPAEAFFGEMGLLDQTSRSSTAVSLHPETTLCLITEDTFGSYLKEKPEKVLSIMANLSKRIRKLTNDYMELCAQIESAQNK